MAEAIDGAVVVTGVSGFIGSHLAQALVSAGTRVVGVDERLPTERLVSQNLAQVLGHPGFRFVRADLRQTDLRPVLADAAVVFHLASRAGVRPSWGDRFADYLQVNVLGTQRIVEACEEVGVPKLVLASSSSVYGSQGDRASVESDCPRPASPYGVSKLAAEQLALAYARRPGSRTSVTALRYFSVYGPRQRSDMWISRVLHAAYHGNPVQIHGDGRQRRDFTYVGDVVAATILAATVSATAQVLNVGAGESSSLLEVIEHASRISGRRVDVDHDSPADGDVVSTRADGSLARALLGFAPSTDLLTGMSRQWSWLVSSLEPREIHESLASTGGF